MQPHPGFFETLALHPALYIGCCVLLGLMIGSFLNVVIHRLPIMMDNELREDYEEHFASPAAEEAAPVEAAVAPETTATADSPTIPAAVAAAAAAESPVSVAASEEPVLAEPAMPAASAEHEPAAEPEAADAAAPKRPAYNLVVPRSACPHCQAPIKAQENIPVVSWLMLGGKCSSCGAPISKRYPIIELSTAILSGLVAWRFGFGLPGLAVLVFTWTLLALAMIDFDTQFLPDRITYPLLWCGLLISLVHPVWAPGADPLTPRDSILGAAAGYLALWGVYWAYKLLTGEEGMGYGDFKLFGALGAWLGWQMLLPTLLIASGVGAIVGGALILLKGKGRRYQIPFGPFLAAAGWLAMMFGHRLVDTYFLKFNILG